MTGTNPSPLDKKSASAKETDRAARKIIDAEAEATRKRTAKLKAERLAKEAREGVTDLDMKTPRRK